MSSSSTESWLSAAAKVALSSAECYSTILWTTLDFSLALLWSRLGLPWPGLRSSSSSTLAECLQPRFQYSVWPIFQSPSDFFLVSNPGWSTAADEKTSSCCSSNGLLTCSDHLSTQCSVQRLDALRPQHGTAVTSAASPSSRFSLFSCQARHCFPTPSSLLSNIDYFYQSNLLKILFK